MNAFNEPSNKSFLHLIYIKVSNCNEEIKNSYVFLFCCVNPKKLKNPVWERLKQHFHLTFSWKSSTIQNIIFVFVITKLSPNLLCCHYHCPFNLIFIKTSTDLHSPTQLLLLHGLCCVVLLLSATIKNCDIPRAHVLSLLQQYKCHWNR